MIKIDGVTTRVMKRAHGCATLRLTFNHLGHKAYSFVAVTDELMLHEEAAKAFLMTQINQFKQENPSPPDWASSPTASGISATPD